MPVRIVESGTFEWPWSTPFGLLVITGASGGGGGGGAAFCMEGLHLYLAGGGGGGGGGTSTTVHFKGRTYRAAGGDGGDGGGGGRLVDGNPVKGRDGRGCHYGDGGDGGAGAVPPPASGQTAANGGRGGKGFAGETRVVKLTDLSVGDAFEMKVGVGGRGGGGGKGFANGVDADRGAGGSVLFVPILPEEGGE